MSCVFLYLLKGILDFFGLYLSESLFIDDLDCNLEVFVVLKARLVDQTVCTFCNFRTGFFVEVIDRLQRFFTLLVLALNFLKLGLLFVADLLLEQLFLAHLLEKFDQDFVIELDPDAFASIGELFPSIGEDGEVFLKLVDDVQIFWVLLYELVDDIPAQSFLHLVGVQLEKPLVDLPISSDLSLLFGVCFTLDESLLEVLVIELDEVDKHH